MQADCSFDARARSEHKGVTKRRAGAPSEHGGRVLARAKDSVKRPFLRLLMAVGRRIGRFFDRPLEPRRPWRTLVIQPGGLGDVLRVFPLIERLQAAEPQAQVSLLTNQGADVLELYAGAQRPRHVPFDLRWGYPRKLQQLARLRREGVELVLSPTRGDGMVECAVMAWLTGASRRVGFEHRGAGFLHSHKRPFVESELILEQNLHLLEAVGIPPGEARLRVRIPAEARAYAAEWYLRHAPVGALRVVVHPWAGSHPEFRAWSFADYGELIGRLVRERDAVVLVLGSEGEAHPDRGLLKRLPTDRVHDLTGATRLTEAVALISDCDVFVGNDSGLLHVALAADVRVVAVFGATPPAQVMSAGARAVAVVAGVPCQPCYRHQPLFNYRCAYSFRCLKGLPVAAVLKEVMHMAPPVSTRDSSRQ